ARKLKAVPASRTGNRLTPAKSNWVVCSPRPRWMGKGIPFATKIPPVMWEPLRAARNSAAVSMPKPGGGAGLGPRRKWCWATAQNGSGTRPLSTSPRPPTLSISITVGSTSGPWRPNSIPMMSPPGCAGSWWRKTGWTTGRSKTWLPLFFQAEDGIRDYKVTGVQTCALPISNMFVLHRKRCDLVEICRNLIDEYTAGTGPALTFEIPGEPVEVEVDADRIGQVILNLLDRKSVV